jgi:hypothetical protein
MINPARGSGVNTAERVPRMTCAVPARALPGARAIAFGQVRMQHLDVDAEAFAQAPHGLRRQADLRHQQQRLPALRQRLRDQRQVHLGLAAAGDAVEHEWLEAARRRNHGIDRVLLFGVERGTGHSHTRQCRCRQFARLDQAGGGQPARCGAPAGQVDAKRIGTGRGGGQCLQQGQTAAAPAAGVQRAASGFAQHPAFAAQCRQRARFAQRGRQRVGMYFARRTQPVVGGPGQRLQQFGIEQRPVVEDAGHPLELAGRQCGVGAVGHHDADPPAAAERHQHAAACRRQAMRWRQIIEQLRQGNGQGDTQDGRHARQCNRSRRPARGHADAIRCGGCPHFLFRRLGNRSKCGP